LPPENLLIKWPSHAGCGFNVSTMCLLPHLQSNGVMVSRSIAPIRTTMSIPAKIPDKHRVLKARFRGVEVVSAILRNLSRISA